LPIIEYKDLTIRYGTRAIVEDVSLTVHEGEKIVLTGPSGAGKSTLLLALLGFRLPSSGSILFQEQPVSSNTISTVRRSLAYIPQEPVLGDELVHRALLLPFTYKHYKNKRPTTARIETILHSLCLSPSILQQKTSSISGGEKQRIAIARALLLGHHIFLTDEITSALDPEAAEAVRCLLLDGNMTILSISHDTAWIARCSRVVTMKNGRIDSIEER
jgi:putative ABC transport system ATP-binding protein